MTNYSGGDKLVSCYSRLACLACSVETVGKKTTMGKSEAFVYESWHCACGEELAVDLESVYTNDEILRAVKTL